MNLAATVELQAGGPGSGCKGPNCGRPSEGKTEEPKSGLYDLLQQASRAWGKENLWGKLAEYGHSGNTEPFTKDEQKDLKQLKRGVGGCKVGLCIMNAQKLAINGLGDPRVQYVEGLVTVNGVPIDHAWIEFNGKVYDPTLANEKWQMKDPTGKGSPTPRGEYFGVVVPKEEIFKHQVTTKMYGFMSHNRSMEDLQKKIWK